MINENMIEAFLKSVDQSFPTPISKKTDLRIFSLKLLDKSTICAEIIADEIVSMVAGYTDHVLDNIGYISIVSTRNEYKGKGYASKLIKDFLKISKNKNLDAVHLYTDKRNVAAIAMYEKIGFKKWTLENESRPDDIHLIYNIQNEEENV